MLYWRSSLFALAMLCMCMPAVAKKKLKNFLKPAEQEQIRFYGFGAFAEKNVLPDGGEKKTGQGFGVYSRLGSDYDINLKKFRFGWYHSLNLGYGKPKYIPYIEDLGFTGAYPIGKHHEVGATYSFLGIYAYSNIANFGSQYSLLYRYRFVQLELAKQNQGILTGCFFSKMKIPAYSITASLLLPKNLIVSAKVTAVNRNERKTDKTTEYRLSLGMAF